MGVRDMARRCTVCAHPELQAVNRALASGTPIRDVAGQFGLSRSALARHGEAHMQEVMGRAAEAQIITDLKLGADLLEHLRDLYQAGLEVLNDARRRGDPMMTLAAIKTLTPVADRLASLPAPPAIPVPGAARMTVEQHIQRQTRIRAMLADLELRAQDRGGSFLAAPPEAMATAARRVLTEVETMRQARERHGPARHRLPVLPIAPPSECG
jgi:hypothetical protein